MTSMTSENQVQQLSTHAKSATAEKNDVTLNMDTTSHTSKSTQWCL